MGKHDATIDSEMEVFVETMDEEYGETTRVTPKRSVNNWKFCMTSISIVGVLLVLAAYYANDLTTPQALESSDVVEYKVPLVDEEETKMKMKTKKVVAEMATESTVTVTEVEEKSKGNKVVSATSDVSANDMSQNMPKSEELVDPADLSKSEENVDPSDWYEILDVLPHDPSSFTQGLTYGNGELYESTGRYGQSKIRRLNATTGTTIQSISIPKRYFGEGLAYHSPTDSLIQLTWKSKTGFTYSAKDLSKTSEYSFQTSTNDGWGITHDPHAGRFVVSDGSNKLHFWDENSLQQSHTLSVTRNGKPVERLNELEYTKRGILANIWYEDNIVQIDPESGMVIRTYDFSKLERKSDAGVLNGISVTDVEDEFFITGKEWDVIYRVKIPFFRTFGR